jgi:hypothetical protein
MTQEQKQNELNTAKILIHQHPERLEIQLEGSIMDWFILLEKASQDVPQLKKAIILTAEFYEFKNNEND